MPVTRHPLHRSGREALPHPAPTSGVTASCLGPPRVARWLAVQASTPGTRAPGSASGACGVAACSPWSSPFPPPTPQPLLVPCSRVSSVLWRCLTAQDRTSPASRLALPDADHVNITWPILSSPSSRARSVHACWGSKTAQSPRHTRANVCLDVAFHSPTSVGALNKQLLRRNTPPTRAPTDFSSASSRRPPHGSGPMWCARPSS